MTHTPGDQGSSLSSLTRQLSPKDVTIDVSRRGLLVERAEELTRLYAEHENWNDVTVFQPEDHWGELFDRVASAEEPYSWVRDSGEV